MRRRIVIQRTTQTVGARGGITDTWATWKTRWARVEPISGGETFTDERERALRQLTFQIRYTSGVKPKDRISWNSRTFDILRVLNIDERNRETHILGEEVA